MGGLREQLSFLLPDVSVVKDPQHLCEAFHMRSRRKTPDVQAEERDARRQRSPARHRQAVAEASSPAQARRAAKHVETGGVPGEEQRQTRPPAWRLVKRHDDNLPETPR